MAMCSTAELSPLHNVSHFTPSHTLLLAVKLNAVARASALGSIDVTNLFFDLEPAAS
jgi:hypothetical protein